jgi:hypothetical protein
VKQAIAISNATDLGPALGTYNSPRRLIGRAGHDETACSACIIKEMDAAFSLRLIDGIYLQDQAVRVGPPRQGHRPQSRLPRCKKKLRILRLEAGAPENQETHGHGRNAYHGSRLAAGTLRRLRPQKGGKR